MTVPYGNGVAARELGADLVGVALGDAWAIHSFVPDAVAAPAAAVVPRQPYREIATHGVEAVHLTAVLLVGRAGDPEAIQNELDLRLDDVRIELTKHPAVVVDAIQSLGQTTNLGGVDYLTARLDFTVNVT